MRRVLAILVVSGYLWAVPLSEVRVNVPEPTPIVLIVSDVKNISVRRTRRYSHYRNHRLSGSLQVMSANVFRSKV
jgi:adenylate kinase